MPPSSALPGLDADLVSAWILGLPVGAQPPLSFRPLGNGKSNLTFLVVDAQGHRWVLRRPPLGKLLPSAHDLGREYRVLSALAGSEAPAPAPIALREPDRQLAVPLLLTEFVHGLTIDSMEAAAEIAPAVRHAISISLACTLSHVHAVDLTSSGLEELSSHEPYATRQLKRWRRQFEQSKTRGRPLVEELATRLEHNVPRQSELTLVHGDYHLANVVADARDGAVLTIVDWELATLGAPLADLGGLLAYWPQGDDPIAPAPTEVTTLAGFASRAELVAAYAEVSGRDISAVGFWEALACWKVAVIAEGVLRRRLDEPDNGDPGKTDRLIDLMLERAALAADRAGF